MPESLRGRMLKDKIQSAQSFMKNLGVDGWLLYDFKRSNPLAWDFLELSANKHLTRRFYYYIPQAGNPCFIIHAVDCSCLDNLLGEKKIYNSIEDLDNILSHLLINDKVIAMEYSWHNNLPYISKVDCGTIEKIRSFGVSVISSENLLQYFSSILSEEQRKSHYEAAFLLNEAFQKALEFIDKNLHQGISEYDVSLFIFNYLESKGFQTDHLPIVAVNANSAIAHYGPTKEVSEIIKPHDFILIDLWCKKKEKSAIYADICRVATIRRAPTVKELEVFSIVFKAQAAAIAFLNNNKKVTGFEVDKVARKVIEDAGYGPYFTHRTGHNIYTSCHGDGAHIDSFETKDTRTLLPKTCFSIEPGIYLEGSFGLRLETDIYISQEGTAQITAGLQDEIIVI